VLAFVHIQKTAGQTVRSLLRRHFGPRHCDIYRQYESVELDDAVWRWIRRCYPKLESIGGHSVVPRGTFDRIDGIRYFTFLRDPSSRALSHYQFLVKRGTVRTSFADWARDNFDRQTRTLAGAADADRAIEVLETKIGFCGLMELFDRSLVMWRRWLDLPGFDIRYRPVNVARSNEIRDRVLADPGNVVLLEEMNQLDQRVYEHFRNVIFPRQETEYGETLDADLAAFEANRTPRRELSVRGYVGRLKRNLVFRPGFKRIVARQKREND
jgi:hypothetical protein